MYQSYASRSRWKFFEDLLEQEKFEEIWKKHICQLLLESEENEIMMDNYLQVSKFRYSKWY